MKKIIIGLFAIVISVGALAKDDPKDKKDINVKALPVLSGQIIDQETGEALTGVMIKVKGHEKSVFTDFDGNFEFKNLEPGKYTFEVSLISYTSNYLENVELTGGEKKALKVELKR